MSDYLLEEIDTALSSLDFLTKSIVNFLDEKSRKDPSNQALDNLAYDLYRIEEDLRTCWTEFQRAREKGR